MTYVDDIVNEIHKTKTADPPFYRVMELPYSDKRSLLVQYGNRIIVVKGMDMNSAQWRI